MGIARHLEERLERLVDGVSAAMFRGKMRPVDLANRLVRFADLRVEDAWIGPTIPNIYRLFVATTDLGRATSPRDLQALGDELSHVLRVTAEENGWATQGPIAVTIEPATEGARTTTVQAGNEPGPMRPWGQLVAVRGAATHGLADNRVGIGRAIDVDVRVDAAEVSRHHAVVFRQGGSTWLIDVGSTNGTWRNHDRVGAEPMPVTPGDALRFGPATFTLRLL